MAIKHFFFWSQHFSLFTVNWENLLPATRWVISEVMGRCTVPSGDVRLMWIVPFNFKSIQNFMLIKFKVTISWRGMAQIVNWDQLCNSILIGQHSLFNFTEPTKSVQVHDRSIIYMYIYIIHMFMYANFVTLFFCHTHMIESFFKSEKLPK